MTKQSTKSSAINWRYEPKGPGYAEHVYVTLTDGRRAELLAWDIPPHSDGISWLEGPPHPDRDWPRQVRLEIYVKDERGKYFTQLTRQRYPDLETAKRQAETLARTDPARWPPEAPWPDPDMPPAQRNKILAERAAVERVIAAGELAGRPIRESYSTPSTNSIPRRSTPAILVAAALCSRMLPFPSPLQTWPAKTPRSRDRICHRRRAPTRS